MYDIRMGREKPGLQPQHLTGVRAAQAISKADVDKAKLGSQSLCFSPVAVTGGEYLFDVSEIKGSAGSATLVLQAILPRWLLPEPAPGLPSRAVLMWSGAQLFIT